MNSMIEELFYGTLRPSGKSSPEADTLRKLIERHETWLAGNLDEAAKAVLDKLADCRREYEGITARENFREGFTLGVRLVMEVVCGAEAEDG